jgi:hypothetical protein
MALNRHHHRALILLGVTVVLVILMGYLIGTATHAGPLHGVYCTAGLATTDGCDLALHGRLQYLLALASMILMIPLWSAVFSFLTVALTASHLEGFHVKRRDG